MATLDIEIAARRYTIACKDGEEQHLLKLAALVDRKAREAERAVGTMSEARQLLFASLLLADALVEGGGAGPDESLLAGPEAADALERLADRIEKLAERLERTDPTP